MANNLFYAMRNILELVEPNNRAEVMATIERVINNLHAENLRVLTAINSWAENNGIVERVDLDADLEKILESVSETLGVPIASLMAPTRKRPVVEARQYCYWLLHKLHPRLSLSATGLLFNKDHATVIHARREFMALIETSPDYYGKLELIIKNLRSRGINLVPAFVDLSNQRQKKINERKAKRDAKSL